LPTIIEPTVVKVKIYADDIKLYKMNSSDTKRGQRVARPDARGAACPAAPTRDTGPRGYRRCYVRSNSAGGVRRTSLPGKQKMRGEESTICQRTNSTTFSNKDFSGKRKHVHIVVYHDKYPNSSGRGRTKFAKVRGQPKEVPKTRSRP
uniref:Reverse transcriptase domain-containing protein n=1 Tax=Heligmosomoides polygyrus TaxID=6339 RepID=A0A8L8K4X2_HELPZ